MRIPKTIALAALLLSAAACTATSPVVEFEGRYWFPKIRDMKVGFNVPDDVIIPPGVDTVVDFQEQLGIEDENVPQVQFRWFTGPNSWIRAEYTPFHFEGDTVLSEPIEQGSGRVKVDDSVWRVTGPDAPAGTKVRVTGGDGAVLTVEPV